MTTKKKTKEPEPFWNDLVHLYFHWYRSNFKVQPIFRGSAPRDLRLIVAMIREYVQDCGVAWDLFQARSQLFQFLQFAYNSEPWLKDHWTLAELYKMREGIFERFKQRR